MADFESRCGRHRSRLVQNCAEIGRARAELGRSRSSFVQQPESTPTYLVSFAWKVRCIGGWGGEFLWIRPKGRVPMCCRAWRACEAVSPDPYLATPQASGLANAVSRPGSQQWPACVPTVVSWPVSQQSHRYCTQSEQHPIVLPPGRARPKVG